MLIVQLLAHLTKAAGELIVELRGLLLESLGGVIELSRQLPRRGGSVVALG